MYYSDTLPGQHPVHKGSAWCWSHSQAELSCSECIPLFCVHLLQESGKVCTRATTTIESRMSHHPLPEKVK